VNSLLALRVLSWLEGLSLLLLLGVAMPLKHVWGLPQPVRVLGSLHGLSFLLFGVALLSTGFERRWSWRRGLALLLLSFVPFGVLRIERALRLEKP
jgi:integral membrane protein